MKKIFTLFIAIFFAFLSNAQVAPDFTATDIHGNEIHLYDILDNGQYVLIDFFFTSCGPCQSVTPKIKNAYEALGCNGYEVFFMEITPSDNDAASQNWCNNYGIEYPTISKDGGGNNICYAYGIELFPTVVLISPDKELVIDDLWPINNETTIINALAPYGIEEHECANILEPEDLTFNILTGEEYGTFYAELEWNSPYPDENITFNIYRNNELIKSNFSETLFDDFTFYDYVYNYPNTSIVVEYCIETIKDGNTSQKTCEYAEIEACVPPYGLIEITTLKDGEVNLAWDYIYFTNLIEKLIVVRNDEVIDEVEIKELIEDDITYYYTDKDENLNLDEFYQYKIVALYSDGCSAESESIFVKPQPSSINDNLNNISIYPNPATDIVNITGNNIQSVEVYNTLGQIIEIIDNIDVNNLTINTSSYNKGTYFIKINANNNESINKLIIY